jgi:hypothetical protein
MSQTQWIVAALVLLVVIIIAVLAKVVVVYRRDRKAHFASGAASLPAIVIFFRHCEKVDSVCDKSAAFPACCVSKHAPPFSCDDCSAQGYLRAHGLPASMTALLAQIAVSTRLSGSPLTAIYAAGSQETNSKCSRSRRMWEITVPLAAAYSLPVNTAYCTDQQQAAAQDILANNPGGIVAVGWEHNALPALVGWTMALAQDPKATAPAKVQKWPGGSVFDQYWIVDLRSGAPVFSVLPEKILPTDCPYPQTTAECVAP